MNETSQGEAESETARASGPKIAAVGAARAQNGARPDLWSDLANPDFGNAVQRICTLCGWSQVQQGVARTMAVASASEREGKSSLAEAIAILTAHDTAANVVLVECDLLNPCLSSDFQIAEGPGLCEILSSDGDLVSEIAGSLRPTRLRNLWLLPAGQDRGNASRLLRSPRMAKVLAAMETSFAFVILDLPAVLTSNDAAVLARLTDGVVFVVRAGATDQRAVQQALWLLTGATIHGVVLNRWRSSIPNILRPIVEL